MLKKLILFFVIFSIFVFHDFVRSDEYASSMDKGIEKQIEKARHLSGVIYYKTPYLSYPLSRDFERNKDGNISFAQSLNLRGYSVDKYSVKPDKNITVETMEKAKEIYNNILESLPADNIKAPIGFLGVTIPYVADTPPSWNVIKDVEKKYNMVPSSIRAFTYLELAFIEKQLGHSKEYKKIISNAIKEIDFKRIDFTRDVDFRKILPLEFNFARPETTLLFLAAEIAIEEKQMSTAEKYYRMIIDLAPSSPLAWESLCKINSFIASKEMVSLQKKMIDKAYPSVWGHSNDLELKKSEILRQLPRTLKQVHARQKKEKNEIDTLQKKNIKKYLSENGGDKKNPSEDGSTINKSKKTFSKTSKKATDENQPKRNAEKTNNNKQVNISLVIGVVVAGLLLVGLVAIILKRQKSSSA